MYNTTKQTLILWYFILTRYWPCRWHPNTWFELSFCAVRNFLFNIQVQLYSHMSGSHVVDIVASRVALQLTHCKMSTSLFSQPYCAQCNGDKARGLAYHVNGWPQLRNSTIINPPKFHSHHWTKSRQSWNKLKAKSPKHNIFQKQLNPLWPLTTMSK